MLRPIISLLFIFLSASAVSSELLRSTESWDGGKFEYPDGTPEITSVKLILEEDKFVPFHCHPVPTMGYVVKGQVEVVTRDGKKSLFSEGQSLIEVMRTTHRGHAVGGQAEIIVFYAGDTDLPNTVLENDADSRKYCH